MNKVSTRLYFIAIMLCTIFIGCNQKTESGDSTSERHSESKSYYGQALDKAKEVAETSHQRQEAIMEEAEQLD